MALSLYKIAQVIGTWRRELKSTQVVLTYIPFQILTADQKTALQIAAQRYADYVEKELVVAN